jgi:hypothetical protein
MSDDTDEYLLKDVHSGTIKQKIGEWVEQKLPDDWDWESEMRQSCGVGLHVGSYDYNFWGDVRVLVEVLPQDVIACNTYHNKLRCTKYKNLSIIGETTEVKELVLE